MKKNKYNTSKAFTVKYKGIVSALITPIRVFSSMQKNKTNILQINAIWDTGATSSAISKKVAAMCNLTPITKVPVYTANGLTDQNVYLVDILLPNNVAVKMVKVTEIDSIHGADALIGMDIMHLGDVSISNYNNITSFSFRMPSCSTTDYVEIANKKSDEIARKEHRHQELLLKEQEKKLCFCGSGKQYRYCCGKKNKNTQTN